MRYLFCVCLCFMTMLLEAQIPERHNEHSVPQAVGHIEDQHLSANGHDCGPNELLLDIKPYFSSGDDPLTYCLSSLSIEGTVDNLQVTLNPYKGILTIPAGWVGVWVTIKMHIIAKNPYGSAMQVVHVYLEPCGG